jgi:membrane-bound ClpP family serine protease
MTDMATRLPNPEPRPFIRAGAFVGGWVWAAVLAVGVSSFGVARAQDPPAGLVVQVPPNDMANATNRLRSLLHGPLKKFESAGKNAAFTVVLDFNPDNRKAESDDFGSCYSLATYLRSLPRDVKGLRTVAFVHGDVRGHSVLPVLACSEKIVFSENPVARLGKVTLGDKRLGATEISGYDEITLNRFPAVIIRKMYDPAVEVIKSADRYHDAREKPRPRGDPVPELGPGETAWYTFAQARNFGLAQQNPRNTLEEVLADFNLPRGGSRRSLDNTVCWRIPIEGPVTADLREKVKRRVERALRARANLLVIELHCAGGESDQAYELGAYLASLNDRRLENPIETIAYVTNEAQNVAAFIAFGCNKIVMQREIRENGEVTQEGAVLGNFERYIQGHPSLETIRSELSDLNRRPGMNPQRREELEGQLRDGIASLETANSKYLADLAARQRYPSLLAAGMFSGNLRICYVESTRGGLAARKFLSAEDFKVDQDGPREWRMVRMIKPALPADENHYLTLTAEQAQEDGIAAYLVNDANGLFELEGVNPGEVRTPDADWLEGLADFLRNPWTSVILVMLGITCLILELKMPGVGLPGVIAAICFVLFFWAHSQLNGQITWLAVLLFVLGLLLIGLEIFVLPGFGVSGISGILLVLASLGLVAYGHWPRSSGDWVKFGQKIGPFGISMLGALAAVAILVRYLPHIPVLNRLMLKPHEGISGMDETIADNPAHAELASLLGAIGVAATTLRPAGKAQFGDAFIDVVGDGNYILPGTRVQVIEVEGNRVVVKAI